MQALLLIVLLVAICAVAELHWAGQILMATAAILLLGTGSILAAKDFITTKWRNRNREWGI